MWRVPSVEPESAQTISSGVRPWPMMRCKTVPKARPGLSVGMTIETEKPPSPITACNERRKPFRPGWLGEPHIDVVKIGGRRAITRADAEDLDPALRPRRRPVKLTLTSKCPKSGLTAEAVVVARPSSGPLASRTTATTVPLSTLAVPATSTGELMAGAPSGLSMVVFELFRLGVGAAGGREKLAR